MNKIFTYLSVLLLVLTAACSSGGKNEHYSKLRQKQEPLGEQCLEKARAYLNNAEYDAAIKEVQSVSRLYPHAISAREQGILLLDSIQLAQSRTELEAYVADHPNDSLGQKGIDTHFEDLCNKVKFYQKKLEHDRQVKHQESK